MNREALGDPVWESLPAELKNLFTEASPAVLAEMDKPTLVVSAADSPDVLRRVCDRLADALPNTEEEFVGRHHLRPAQ